MKRSQYPQNLRSISLSREQIAMLRDVISDLSTYAQKLSNIAESYNRQDVSSYYAGKADGLNALDRFLRGDMLDHDEFEDEETSIVDETLSPEQRAASSEQRSSGRARRR